MSGASLFSVIEVPSVFAVIEGGHFENIFSQHIQAGFPWSHEVTSRWVIEMSRNNVLRLCVCVIYIYIYTLKRPAPG